jgi:hypothetical protein
MKVLHHFVFECCMWFCARHDEALLRRLINIDGGEDHIILRTIFYVFDKIILTFNFLMFGMS